MTAVRAVRKVMKIQATATMVFILQEVVGSFESSFDARSVLEMLGENETLV